MHFFLQQSNAIQEQNSHKNAQISLNKGTPIPSAGSYVDVLLMEQNQSESNSQSQLRLPRLGYQRTTSVPSTNALLSPLSTLPQSKRHGNTSMIRDLGHPIRDAIHKESNDVLRLQVLKILYFF
jgi:hypothetical protein